MSRSAALARPPSGAARTASACVGRLVILVDVTNFTALRRRVGVGRANRLVVEVGARAGQVASASEVISAGRTTIELRLSGGLDEAQVALERIAACFAKPVYMDSEPYGVELLLAAAVSPTGGLEEVGLIEEAEEALTQARSERRSVIRDTSKGALAGDRQSLARELAGAVEHGQLFLQYQPKLHVRRQQVASVEALMRWDHPRRGLILPGDFITIAEEMQLIGPMTLWAVRQAIADQAVLAADGHDLTVFVNIAGQLLGDGAFVDALGALIGDAGRIGVEITETSMIRDPDVAIGHLKALADRGVPIAIDDYGAGLSSLAYLKKLPASELKIDKMFVMELTSSNRDPLIVRSTIDLAHAMEMEVTAEGVETPAALALLSVMGCDMAQGYLISRPVSVGALRQFLADQASGVAEAQSPFQRSAAFWKRA